MIGVIAGEGGESVLRGIYTAASGMLLEGIKTDVVANNLANASTVGFKRQQFAARAFPEMLIQRIHDPVRAGRAVVDPRPVIGLLGTGAALDELALDMAPAPLRYTGNPLDIAVDGPGFFAVETGTGQVAYTRDGRMTVGADGFLRTTSGFLVLGVGGPIPVGEGVPAIDETGQVYVNGEVVGQLALWEFAEPRALARLGDNLLAPSEGSGEPLPAVASRVRQEHLEGANVNVVREMVDLIATQRAYEANQKMIQVQDETLGRLINDAASLA